MRITSISVLYYKLQQQASWLSVLVLSTLVHKAYMLYQELDYNIQIYLGLSE